MSKRLAHAFEKDKCSTEVFAVAGYTLFLRQFAVPSSECDSVRLRSPLKEVCDIDLKHPNEPRLAVLHRIDVHNVPAGDRMPDADCTISGIPCTNFIP